VFTRGPSRGWKSAAAIGLVAGIFMSLALLCGPGETAEAPDAAGTARQRRIAALIVKLRRQADRERVEVRDFARRHRIAVRRALADGALVELRRVRNNRPFYYITMNFDAADTVGTDELWPGGSTGLDLTGAGITLGIWDGGAVRETHQEFGARVTQRDGASSYHYHSCHVAGTMIASGVDWEAKGMSIAANLDAYDWSNDEGEMASAAAAGLQISNHSYGYIRGWRYNYFGDGLWAWFGTPGVSITEDYLFGFYNSDTRTWDQIAHDAPGYLICKSAGNDRNDSGPAAGTQHWIFDGGWVLSTDTRDADGGGDGYDCVGEIGSAKNILTVGAVVDITGGYSAPGDVSMTSFSCWGPTDDGRIKPDLVANGNSLYSSYDSGDAAYGRLSGTSMSAPNTSGTLGLILRHYLDERAAAPRAATLKALVLHTANEAGANPGPDYSFGWGLLNAVGAADVITGAGTGEASLREETLNDGATFEISVDADGSGPLKAMIVWTDPPGTPPAPSLDPTTKMLVNDLDLRITRDANTWYPWVLDPANPGNAATTGDNDTDNVEQVVIDSPSAGTYTVTVSHKGTLDGGSQDFSLIVTGVVPSGPESFPLNVNAGWNLVSFPVEPDDPDVNAVFAPAVISEVWEYTEAGGYSQPTQVHAKKGYWVKASQADTLTITGTRPADKSLSLTSGWNLVGVVGPDAGQPSQPVPTDAAVTAIWQYLPPYGVPAATCQDGRGFFIRATGPVTIWQN